MRPMRGSSFTSSFYEEFNWRTKCKQYHENFTTLYNLLLYESIRVPGTMYIHSSRSVFVFTFACFKLASTWCNRFHKFWCDFSLRLKYQKNMAPKKSKVKKPKVKRSVTQPAKSIIERTICSHPMLKRVQKEVRELKKKSAKKYKK